MWVKKVCGGVGNTICEVDQLDQISEWEDNEVLVDQLDQNRMLFLTRKCAMDTDADLKPMRI